MLKLIRELGQDHGKTVLLSTHLLADVQTVCDQVVVMAGGRVRRQGSVQELCERRSDRYRVRIQGAPAAFVTALESLAVEILEDAGRGEYRVRVPPGWDNWRFFAVAQASEVVLRGILRDDESVEELFLRTVSGA
jgi:ABC-2 type transport system ATP-binding protein